MPSRRMKVREALVELFVFMLLHSFFTGVMTVLIPSLTPMFYSLILALPCYLFMFTRRAKTYVFYPVHILFPVIPLLMPFSNVTKAAVFLFLFIPAIRSVVLRVKKIQPKFDTGVLVAGLIPLMLLSIALNALQMTAQARMIAVWVWVMLICWLIYRQTTALDNSLELLADKARLSLTSIRSQNNGILLTFLVPAGLLFLPLCFIPFDRMLGPLSELILRAVSFMLSSFRIPQAEDAGPPPVILPEAVDHGYANVNVGISSYIFTISFIVIVFIALLWMVTQGVIRLIRRFRRMLSIRRKDTDEITEIIDKNEKSPLEAFRRLFTRRARTAAEKIRRRYYKTVSRYIKNGISVRDSDTTEEIKAKINDDISELTEQYKQARYGA